LIDAVDQRAIEVEKKNRIDAHWLNLLIGTRFAPHIRARRCDGTDRMANGE
jgi:hypothetical protein